MFFLCIQRSRYNLPVCSLNTVQQAARNCSVEPNAQTWSADLESPEYSRRSPGSRPLMQEFALSVKVMQRSKNYSETRQTDSGAERKKAGRGHQRYQWPIGIAAFQRFRSDRAAPTVHRPCGERRSSKKTNRLSFDRAFARVLAEHCSGRLKKKRFQKRFRQNIVFFNRPSKAIAN